jgi:hypothetical protein
METSVGAQHRWRATGALVIALIMLAALAATGAQAAEAPCAPYMFIGVRGSGDPKNTMGSQVGPEWRALSADLQGSGINVNDHTVIDDLALNYPAVPVIHDYHLPGGRTIPGPDVEAAAYAASVLAGTVQIVHEAKRCKGSKLILAGHSQGAHAIMLALPLLDHKRILAVTLFGDPIFRGSSYAAEGSFDARRNGLAAGARLSVTGIPGLATIGFTAGVLDAISKNAYPADLKGRLFDYCNMGDGVCQGLFHCSFSDGCQFNGFATHSDYANKDNGSTEKAAAIIARLIRDDQGTQGHPIAEPAPQSKGPVDVVFAIDTTGSMAPIIDSVLADVRAMASQIASVEPDYRLALVAYRDALPYCDDYYQATTVQDFTPDTAAFSAAVGSLIATGGCDEPESVFTGAMQGLGLTFRPGATKVEILVGDAPGHDPDPVTNYSASDVVTRAQSQSVSIYGLDGGNATQTFSQLAGPTGGKVVSTAESDQVPAAIQQAISAQATAPSASAGSSPAFAVKSALTTGRGTLLARGAQAPGAAVYTGPIGIPIPLSAADSWSPLGRALTYHWDFNSDGVVDVNTDVPVITNTWTTPFDGDVTLTVTDSAGQSAVTRVHVSVAGSAIAIPAKPQKPHVTRSGSGVRITWTAGHGGGVPAAYVLRSAGGVVISYLAPRKRRLQATVIRHVGKRTSFKVRVSAVNAAGESPISAPSNALLVERPRRRAR